MAPLVLVRHAQASFDEDDYDRLSELGATQAQTLGRWWARSASLPAQCWSGGMRRQQDTALLAAAAAAQVTGGISWPTLSVDERLREYDHRAIFYAHRPELRTAQALAEWKQSSPDYGQLFTSTWSAALQRWMDGDHDADYPETWPAFRARCLAALQERQRANPGNDGPVLIFTSSGPISVLIQACRDLSDAELATLQSGLVHTGITELWPAPDGTPAHCPGRLEEVNATPHLPPLVGRTLR
jgi:broad specificity phosphatase PhoE